MKKIVALAFGVCLMGGAAKAQTIDSKYGVDSVKTIENASIYTEFVKQKNYKDALPAWRYVYQNAPRFQLNTYVRGEEILTGMFKETKDYAYIDTLMMVYDQRIKYFGDHARYSEGYILGKKGADLYRFGRKNDETKKQAYTYLTKSFDMEGSKSHPVTVQIMFFAAGELLEHDAITKEEYINLYSKISDYMAKGIEKAAKPEVFVEMKQKVDGLFFQAGAADCETLNTLLTAKYEANKEDMANLKEISTLLRRMECVDLPLYATIAEQIYQQEPTADAAYSLAIMFLKRQEFDKTEAYLREAISKSDDVAAKGEYSLRLSQIMLSKGKLQEAKRYALEAIKGNPNSGAAYILIGKAYALESKNYGEDDFDKSSVFWAAVDKFVRAKSVDPSVASEADKLISTYEQYFPSKDEAFFRSINAGSTVKLGSWINESTTARFRKQ
ncbi:MAG: tetratricopeptide repeat protein [Marinifilaceae bacterium]